MGTICGCNREGDDFQETNLAERKLNKSQHLNDNELFDKKFEEKLSSMGEYFSFSFDEIIPKNIKSIREDQPMEYFSEENMQDVHYKDEVKLKNEIIYRGGWNNLIQMEGKGLMLLSNDQVLLEGIWKDGNFVRGRIYFNDGSYYEGEVSGKLLNGQGKYANSNNEKYEGSFVNGFREGQGCYYYNDGCIYIGEFKQDYLFGNGIITWSNGTTYKGEIYNNVLEGHGILNLPNGSKYDGQFKNNWPDGEGEFTWSNGVIYRGKYEIGKKEGKGQYKCSNVDIQGTWSYGVLQGKAVIKYKNQSYSTLWRNGKLLETENSCESQNIDFFNSISIQAEEYDPKELSHLIILNDSSIYYFKPFKPAEIGTKSYESYFNSPR